MRRRHRFRFVKLSKKQLRRMSVRKLIARMSMLEDYRLTIESLIRQGVIRGEKAVRRAKRKIQSLKEEYRKTDEVLQEKG